MSVGINFFETSIGWMILCRRNHISFRFSG